jgi:hypothetical protein
VPFYQNIESVQKMKSIDLKELIHGLLIVIFLAAAMGRLNELHRWVMEDFFNGLNIPFTAPARLSPPKQLSHEHKK